MVSYTSRIRATLQDTGTNFNTWGIVLNQQDLDIFDEAFGVETIALTGVNITLTSANGATDQARNMGFRFTGTGGCSVTIPSVEAVKSVFNNTSGTVTVKTSASAGVSISSGTSAQIMTDGVDVWIVATNLSAADLSAIFTATSGTSQAIVSSGDVTFTLNETYRAFAVGMLVRAAVTTDPETYISGVVKTYVPSGTSLTITATGSAGTGTYSAWTISFDQAQVTLPPQTGQAGKFLGTNGLVTSWENIFASNAQTLAGTSATVANTPASAASIAPIRRSARTSNTQIVRADIGAWIDITSGTFSQTFAACAALGANWWCYLGNSGTGDITLDPNGSETIDGLTSYIMYPGEVRIVTCDGTALRTIVLNAYSRIFSTSGSFTKPPGYAKHLLDEQAPGGGAGSGARGSARTPATGAGGGGRLSIEILDSEMPSSPAAVVVGAAGIGGAAVTSDNTNGNNGTDGGTSSFGGKWKVSGGTGGKRGTQGGGTQEGGGDGGKPVAQFLVGGTGYRQPNTAAQAGGPNVGGGGGGLTSGLADKTGGGSPNAGPGGGGENGEGGSQTEERGGGATPGAAGGVYQGGGGGATAGAPGGAGGLGSGGGAGAGSNNGANSGAGGDGGAGRTIISGVV